MLRHGHTTPKLATLAVTLLALAAPTAASAAEQVYVSSGTLYYLNSLNEVDHLTVTDGGTTEAGQYLVTETSTPSAFAGAGCTGLSLGKAACAGPLSTIWAELASGADRVTIDVPVAATVYGGSEDDVIVGGGRGDWVFGGTGNDAIHGRGGGDWISGDGGDDLIEARDGVADVVLCGAGIDTAYVDEGEGTSGCETVIRDPYVASPLFTPPPPAPVDPVAEVVPAGPPAGAVVDAFAPDAISTLLGPLRIASALIPVSATGVASFDLSCAATETAGCRGQVFLDPVLSGKKGKARGKARRAKVRAVASRRGRYGRSKFVVAGGKRRKLDVRLSGAARNALGLVRSGKARAARRGRAVRAKVTVVQRGRRPQKTVVTLRG